MDVYDILYMRGTRYTVYEMSITRHLLGTILLLIAISSFSFCVVRSYTSSAKADVADEDVPLREEVGILQDPPPLPMQMVAHSTTDNHYFTYNAYRKAANIMA